MHLLIYLLLFVSPSNQKIVSGFVKDNNGNPLPYVNIVSISKKNGTVTNDKGFFEINVEIIDSIKFSHIAYKSKTVCVKDLKSDTIILVENYISINEIVIKSSINSKSKTKLGFYGKDRKGEFILSPGNQIAVFIDNPKRKNALINSITFEVKKAGNCYSKLRLRLLDNPENSMFPGRDLLLDNYIIENNYLSKTNTIDVSKSKVLLPQNGIFAVIEWLSIAYNCNEKSYPSLTANLSTKENVIWFNFRDKRWNRPNIKPLPNGNYMTPNISLSVTY